MAGYLPKQPSVFHPIPYARIAILAAQWHKDCVESMVERAKAELMNLGVEKNMLSVHWLPGSLELPYAAQVLFEQDQRLDAILAFGVVLQGQTSHDSSVIQTVVSGFSDVSRRFSKPIINEVIGVNCIEDAQKRSGDGVENKGLEAVFAVSELLHWKKKLR